MPAYDQQWFDPLAPLVFAVIRNPETGAEQADIPMNGPNLSWAISASSG